MLPSGECTHTHTTVLLLVWNMSGSTRVSRYQKGKTKKVKTNSGFTEARDSEWQWHLLGYMQVCTPCRQPRQHPTTLLSAGSVIYRHFSTFSPVFAAVFTAAIATCYRNKLLFVPTQHPIFSGFSVRVRVRVLGLGFCVRVRVWLVLQVVLVI